MTKPQRSYRRPRRLFSGNQLSVRSTGLSGTDPYPEPGRSPIVAEQVTLGGSQAPDDRADACPLILIGGQVAERQHDMPPAPPALGMPLASPAQDRRWRTARARVTGRISRAYGGRMPGRRRAVRPADTPHRGCRVAGQPAGAGNRGPQGLDHLCVGHRGMGFVEQAALDHGLRTYKELMVWSSP